MVYLILGIILFIVYWRWRLDYRNFQKMYRIKLPFLCTVKLTKENDKMLRGNKRYRYITQKGRRDMRRSWNFKLTYPTKIVVNHFEIKIWNLRQGDKLFTMVEPYMRLKLADIMFKGPIEGDPIEFFQRSQIIFQRWVGKLFSFYGWNCELAYGGPASLVASKDGIIYPIYTKLTKDKIGQGELMNLPKVGSGMRLICVTNSKYTSAAFQYACDHNILLMDSDCLRKCFVYEYIMFM